MSKIKLFIFIFVMCLLQGKLFSQENAFTALDVSLRNSIKLNKFLINPAFSYAREEAPTLNLGHKRQAVNFENAPVLSYGSYVGKIANETRFGLGGFSQKMGVLDNLGGIVNFSHNLKMSETSNLTFGLNTYIYSSKINASRVVSENPEPLLEGQDNATILIFKPGINYNFNNFDIGITYNNLITYNFATSESAQDDSGKGFSGHIMYTTALSSGYGILDEAKFVTMLQAENLNETTGYSGMLLLDQARIGWLQAGYNSTYGANAGLGFKITENLALGYAYNMGISNTELYGSSHEFSLSYSFKEYEQTYKRKKQNKKKDKEKEETAKDKEKTVAEEKIEELEQELKVTKSPVKKYQSDIENEMRQSDRQLGKLEDIVKDQEEDLNTYLEDDTATTPKSNNTKRVDSKVAAIKDNLEENKKSLDNLIDKMENAKDEQLSELKNSNADENSIEELEKYYDERIQELKDRKQEYVEAEQEAYNKLAQIRKDKEEERLKRTGEEVTKNNGINEIEVDISEINFSEDGEMKTIDIPVIEKLEGEKSGYYLVLETFTSTDERDAFIEGSGENNLKTLYNTFNETYYVYVEYYSNFPDALNALSTKTTETNNKKMFIIKVK